MGTEKRRTTGFMATQVWAVTVTMVIVLCFSGLVGAQEKVELSVLHCWTPPRDVWVDDQINVFKREFPNVEVSVYRTSCSSLALEEQLLVSMIAGDPYDVVMMTSSVMVDFAAQGTLTDLTPFLARKGISTDIWFPSELASGQWQGRIYGLPHRAGADMNNILLYNTQLFAESGLDPDSPPETFDQLHEAARSLVRFDGDKIQVAPFDFVNQGSFGPLAWLHAGGGKYVSEDGTQAAFNSDEAHRTIEFIRDFISTHMRGPESILGGKPAFLNNQVAMVGRGTFFFAELKAHDPDVPVAMSLRPRHPDSPWTGVHEGTLVFGIPQGVKHVEEAWNLIYYLTIDEESAGNFLLRQGRPSPIREYNFNPEYFRVNPYFGIIPTAMETAYPVPIVPGFTEAKSYFDDMWKNLERNHHLAPGNAFEETARTVTRILQEHAR